MAVIERCDLRVPTPSPLFQGITLKLVNHKLIIARILYGGLIHRQGLMQVGDRIVEVNQESVDAMNPSDLQEVLVCRSDIFCIVQNPYFLQTRFIMGWL